MTKNTEFKVINAGNCMICHKPIKYVPTRNSTKFPDIFFCKECSLKMSEHKKINFEEAPLDE